MNRQFQKTFYATAVSVALAAMLTVPAAMAQEGEDGGSGANINKNVDINVDLSYEGDVEVDGYIWGDGLAEAVTETNQNQSYNAVVNDRNDNNASMGDNALSEATGNIHANVAAGDNNAQSNSTAISAIDAASFVFGHATAHTFANQSATYNYTENYGAHNNANLGDNALRGASGNIGVNIAAGTNNGQQNATAISRGTGSLAEATTSTSQNTSHNVTANLPSLTEESKTVEVSLNVELSGDYEGTSDQIGDVYPDIWSYDGDKGDHDQHPVDTPELAHMDLDTETQGGSDLNGDGGALAFNEAGTLELSGTAAGSITYDVTVLNRRTVNNASIDGNALQGASGNIGVNVAAGTNNLQSNSLAIAVTGPCFTCNGGGGGIPE